jgi:hypothetical protein
LLWNAEDNLYFPLETSEEFKYGSRAKEEEK